MVLLRWLGKFAQWLERRYGQALESWFNVQLAGVEIRLNSRMDRLESRIAKVEKGRNTPS